MHTVCGRCAYSMGEVCLQYGEVCIQYGGGVHTV